MRLQQKGITLLKDFVLKILKTGQLALLSYTDPIWTASLCFLVEKPIRFVGLDMVIQSLLRAIPRLVKTHGFPLLVKKSKLTDDVHMGQEGVVLTEEGKRKRMKRALLSWGHLIDFRLSSPIGVCYLVSLFSQ